MPKKIINLLRSTIMTFSKFTKSQLVIYIREFQLVYFGIIICCVFTYYFSNLFDGTITTKKVPAVFIILYFLISFILPIILSLIFTINCFTIKAKKKCLIHILHSYFATIFIFAGLFYQCCVFGDYEDAVQKEITYRYQKNQKINSSSKFLFLKVSDQRAFKGIKPRIWSGYDYPSDRVIFEKNLPESWHHFTKNENDDLSIESIESIVLNTEKNEIEYQHQNCLEVYIDCLYFSTVSIATVGFGDISPNLGYTKLFAILEILIGISIFVFALGMLFSNWQGEDI